MVAYGCFGARARSGKEVRAMREANDRGYECLLPTDCCAATDAGNHAAAVKMVTMQNGIFGAIAPFHPLLEALRPS